MKVLQLHNQLKLHSNNRNKLLKQYYQVHSLTLSNLQALRKYLSMICKLKCKHNNYLNNIQATLQVVLQTQLIAVFVKMSNIRILCLSTLKLIQVYLQQKLVLAKHRSCSSNHNQLPIYLLLNSRNLRYLTVNTMRQRILFSQSKLMLVQAN